MNIWIWAYFYILDYWIMGIKVVIDFLFLFEFIFDVENKAINFMIIQDLLDFYRFLNSAR